MISSIILASTAIPDWVLIVAGIFGTSGIGYWVVQRVVDRKKYHNSELQQEADQKKTDAETDKTKAEAVKVKAEADVAVAEVALKIAERLRVECETSKNELKEKDMALEKTQQDLNSVRASLRQALDKIDNLQTQLDREIKINLDMTDKNIAMAKQILDLTEQLNKLRGHG